MELCIIDNIVNCINRVSINNDDWVKLKKKTFN